MTTTVKALGGGAQPASIDTSGKVTGGPALRVYGFDSEAAAQAAGYVCEGGPAMSVALITDAQIASGAWKAEGDPNALVIYTAPDNMPIEGGYSVPVYPVNGWGSSAPVPSGPQSLLDFRSDTGVTTNTTGYSGTGTITQSGTTISGTNTLFQLEAVVGDQITASGISGIVQSITSDTELELDTTASVAVAVVYTITPQANTARVTDWANQGTLGGSFTQSSAAARPALQTLGGIKYVRLDGFNDWMLGDTGWSSPLNNPDTFTVYFVLKSTTTEGHHIDILTKVYDPSNSNAGWEFDECSGFTQDEGANNYTYRGNSRAFDGSAVHLIQFDVTRSTCSFVVNGVDQNSSGNSSGTVADMSNDQPVRLGIMGVGTNPADLWFYNTPFLIMRMLIYSPALSVDDNAAMVAQLMSDYGISAPVQPEFISGSVVDAHTVDIVFSTDMYSQGMPVVNIGPDIKVNGSSIALATNARIVPTTLRYTSPETISSGDSVTWEYTFNPAAPLVSADVGWALANVSPQTVTNGL